MHDTGPVLGRDEGSTENREGVLGAGEVVEQWSVPPADQCRSLQRAEHNGLVTELGGVGT